MRKIMKIYLFLICLVGGPIFTKTHYFCLQSCLIYAITKEYQQIQPTFCVYPPLSIVSTPLLQGGLGLLVGAVACFIVGFFAASGTKDGGVEDR